MPTPIWIKGHPVLRRVWSRLHNKNQNWNCAIIGPNGMAKSYSAMSIADMFDVAPNGDHRFSIDRVAFSPEEFLNLVKQDFPKGTFLVFDEATLTTNARTFFSQNNMIMSYINQAYRFKNYGVIYTFPANLGFLDYQVRSLLHAYIDMRAINYSRKIAIGVYYDISQARHRAEPYNIKPRFMDNGEGSILKSIGIPHPRKELAREYEKRKKAHIDSLFENYSSQIASGGFGVQVMEARSQRKSQGIAELIKNPEAFKKEIQDRSGIRDIWNFGKIAKEFRISVRTARDWIQEIECV